MLSAPLISRSDKIIPVLGAVARDGLTAEFEVTSGLLESGNLGKIRGSCQTSAALTAKAAGTPCGQNGNCNPCDEIVNPNGMESGMGLWGGALGLVGSFLVGLITV